MADDRRRPERDPALVRNAADPSQVKRAGRMTARRRDRELDALRFLLGTEQGRAFLVRLFRHVRVPGFLRVDSADFGSIWESSAAIHYNAGAQDVGLFFLRELEHASPDAVALLLKTARATDRNEDLENAASRTPAATETTDEGDQ